jgi:TolB-like protein/TM2 domain-containing membrane protein YozV
MLTSVIEWLKEYGDVLGGAGSIIALTTLVATNGRLILARLTGKPLPENASDELPALSGKNIPAPNYGGKTAIAVLAPTERGDVTPHFSDGLTDDLIADLKGAGFAVAARDTTMEAFNKLGETKKIATALGVGYVLSASVRQDAEIRRVTVQVCEACGSMAWSGRFDASGANMISIQESVASDISNQIAAEIQTPEATSVEITPSIDIGFSEPSNTAMTTVSPKSQFIAFLLCLLAGIFGAHRYYVGRPFTGILYTLTLGLFTIGWLLDLILILFGLFADGKGRAVKLFQPQRVIKNA